MLHDGTNLRYHSAQLTLQLGINISSLEFDLQSFIREAGWLSAIASDHSNVLDGLARQMA